MPSDTFDEGGFAGTVGPDEERPDLGLKEADHIVQGH